MFEGGGGCCLNNTEVFDIFPCHKKIEQSSGLAQWNFLVLVEGLQMDFNLFMSSGIHTWSILNGTHWNDAVNLKKYQYY